MEGSAGARIFHDLFPRVGTHRLRRPVWTVVRWWQEWPQFQKDHGTICISCHTVVPYAMARPALRQEFETGMAAPEKIVMDSVEKRVKAIGRRWFRSTPTLPTA